MIDELNADEETALHRAAESGGVKCVQTLHARGANLAARTGNTRPLPCGPMSLGRVNRTALHHAVLQNNMEMAKILLIFGAAPNAKNLQGQTPLILSVEKEFVDLTKAMSRAGGDMHLENAEGESAYKLASQRQLLSLLISSN